MVHRRQFSAEFKANVVLEVVSGAKTAAEICREHRLKPDLFSKWKSQFLREASKIFQSPEPADPAQARIAELERLVGRLTLEVEAAKKASPLLRSAASRNVP
jgi:transposase-like protein